MASVFAEDVVPIDFRVRSDAVADGFIVNTSI